MKLSILLLALANSWTKIEAGPTTVCPVRRETDIFFENLSK